MACDLVDNKVLAYLGFTPFGLYCKVCRDGVDEKYLRYHMQTKHPGVVTGSFHGLLGRIKRAQPKARVLDLEEYLQGPVVTGFQCLGCSVAFKSSGIASRHVAKVCRGAKVVAAPCRRTICGRLLMVDYLESLRPHQVAKSEAVTLPGISPNFQVRISTNPIVTTATETAKFKISKYVREDEDVGVYAKLFHNVISGSNDLPASIKLLLSLCSPPGDHDFDLQFLVSLADTWLHKYYPIHVSKCPANFRAAILSFEGHTVGDVNFGTTFTCRHDIQTLCRVLKPLICLGWRHSRNVFRSIRQEVLARGPGDQTPVYISNGLIPRMLTILVLEKTTSFLQTTLAEEFCFCMCFREKESTSDNLILQSCGGSASHIATTLHLLRAGVLSYLSILEGRDLFAVSFELVSNTRLSTVVNILAPAIRVLREMASRKPPSKDRIVTPNGDILIRGFTFAKSIWSTKIPRLSKMAFDLFNRLFVGGFWKEVLDVAVPMSVTIIQGKVEFDLSSENPEQALSLVDNPNFAIIDRLTSIMEVIHHGVGLGAFRKTEVERLSVHAVRHSGDCLYYFSQPIKRFSTTQRRGSKLVEHKLPRGLTRAVLLFRWLVQTLLIGEDEWIPSRGGRNYFMTDTIADLFELKSKPSALDVRQYIASLCNVLFPSNSEFSLDDEIVSSEDMVSEQSGHAVGTHQQRYSTAMEGSLESKYQHLHRCLGDVSSVSSSNGGTSKSKPISIGLLRQCLSCVFGDGAQFRGELQRRLILSATNSLRHHSHASIPCGGGKSLTWVLSSLSTHFAGVQATVNVVVVPYKFLAAYHTLRAKGMLGTIGLGPTAETVASVSITADNLPNFLKTAKSLPSILILTVDAISRLVKYHYDMLMGWSRSGVIRKIFIDEIHTLLSEYSFRPAYQSLKSLAQLGIPIMTLSGSLPPSIASSICRYLGLSSASSSVDIIEGGDVIGDGFTFRVLTCNNSSAANAAYEAYRHVNEYPGTSVHVLCSTKNYADTAFKLLKSRRVRVAMVTSDNTSSEQAETADAWYKGQVAVLVSTTVALVGNENPNCRHIIVCGLIYNLSNMVQAIGRLRQEQRGRTSFVTVVYKRKGEPNFREQCRDDSMNQKLLLDAGVTTADLSGTIRDILGIQSLHQVLNQKETCYIQLMSSRFGHDRAICRRCSNCTNNNSVQVQATSTTQAAEEAIDHRKRAIHFLLELTEQCTCGINTCDGTKCLHRFGLNCFRCGGSHGVKQCTFDIELALRGQACSRCWELYSIFPIHRHTECRVKSRLRTKLLRHAKDKRIKGGVSAVVAKMMVSEDSWFECVSILSTPSVYYVTGEHIADDDINSPLLPPDVIDGVVGNCDEDYARNVTQAAFLEEGRVKRRRLFLDGYLYKNLFPTNYLILDGDMDLDIVTPTGGATTFRIRDAQTEGKMLGSLLSLCHAMPLKGTVRRRVGDIGEMWALGFRSFADDLLYVPTKQSSIAEALEKSGPVVRKYMTDTVFHSCLGFIDGAEYKSTKGRSITKHKCLESSPSLSIMVTRDLGNSSHFDWDSSPCCVFFVEDAPGQATNWMFILPNVRVAGYRGVVVKLKHGRVLEWDGRHVRHCTSVTNTGSNNNVYGVWYGCCIN